MGKFLYEQFYLLNSKVFIDITKWDIFLPLANLFFDFWRQKLVEKVITFENFCGPIWLNFNLLNKIPHQF